MVHYTEENGHMNLLLEHEVEYIQNRPCYMGKLSSATEGDMNYGVDQFSVYISEELSSRPFLVSFDEKQNVNYVWNFS